MSTKHVRNAADLARFGAGLRIECDRCGNATTLDGFEVARSLGTANFARLQPRLKCSRCGAKAAKFAILSPPPRRD